MRLPQHLSAITVVVGDVNEAIYDANGNRLAEQHNFTVPDLCRLFGIPVTEIQAFGSEGLGVQTGSFPPLLSDVVADSD